MRGYRGHTRVYKGPDATSSNRSKFFPQVVAYGDLRCVVRHPASGGPYHPSGLPLWGGGSGRVRVGDAPLSLSLSSSLFAFSRARGVGCGAGRLLLFSIRAPSYSISILSPLTFPSIRGHGRH